MRRHAISATSALAILLSGLLSGAAAPAFAGQALTVEADQSQMVVLPGIPGSVVIGNPTIADATVEGSKMFIHGRSFGTTNFVIMDLDGQQMAAFDVSVSHTTANTLALYRGPARISYNCTPTCEAEFQIGDDPTYTGIILEQTKKKIELATGTDTAKSEAPPAPQ